MLESRGLFRSSWRPRTRCLAEGRFETVLAVVGTCSGMISFPERLSGVSPGNSGRGPGEDIEHGNLNREQGEDTLVAFQLMVDRCADKI